LLLYVLGYFGIIYLAIALIFGLLLLLGNIFVYFRPTKKRLYAMFKFSSPYLVVVFLAMILDTIIA
jgi:protoheme IX farnesyltransferase